MDVIDDHVRFLGGMRKKSLVSHSSPRGYTHTQSSAVSREIAI